MQAAMNPAENLSTSPLGARDLVKVFGGLRAVDGMSIALRQGELLGLIGPNGAGKTTLFNLLAGSLKPTSGSIVIGGRDMTSAGPDARIANGGPICRRARGPARYAASSRRWTRPSRAARPGWPTSSTTLPNASRGAGWW